MYLLSETDRSELRAVSNTYQYFFKPLDSKAQLQEISISMLTLQWRYLSEAFSKLYQMLKCLLQLPYYLLSADFTQAGDSLHNSINAFATSLVKFVLFTLFTCLHALRLVTLLLSSAWLKFSELSGDEEYIALIERKQKNRREVTLAFKELEEDYLRILEEREDILLKIGSINRQVNYQLSQFKSTKINEYSQLFQQEPVVDFKRQQARNIAIELKNLLDSYPDFDSDSLSNLKYIKEYNKKIYEHHYDTVNLADLFFANKTQYLCS